MQFALKLSPRSSCEIVCLTKNVFWSYRRSCSRCLTPDFPMAMLPNSMFLQSIFKATRSHFQLFGSTSKRTCWKVMLFVKISIRGAGHPNKAFQSQRTQLPECLPVVEPCWLFVPRRCPIVPLKAPTNENPTCDYLNLSFSFRESELKFQKKMCSSAKCEVQVEK